MFATFIHNFFFFIDRNFFNKFNDDTEFTYIHIYNIFRSNENNLNKNLHTNGNVQMYVRTNYL